MEGKTTIEVAQAIMGDNIIGPNSLHFFLSKIGYQRDIFIPKIPYDVETLNQCANSHLLILGIEGITIRLLRSVFGIDPDKSEPCFYNQDWYMNQDFIDLRLSNEWFLIQKDVLDSTRASQPDVILSKNNVFPSALQCVYSFFVYYFANSRGKLWEFDFVWCNDFDHNGDRIYVGKYTDIDGVNKSGFSIHRHLSLRNCYGAVYVL